MPSCSLSTPCFLLLFAYLTISDHFSTFLLPLLPPSFSLFSPYPSFRPPSAYLPPSFPYLHPPFPAPFFLLLLASPSPWEKFLIIPKNSCASRTEKFQKFPTSFLPLPTLFPSISMLPPFLPFSHLLSSRSLSSPPPRPPYLHIPSPAVDVAYERSLVYFLYLNKFISKLTLKHLKIHPKNTKKKSQTQNLSTA